MLVGISQYTPGPGTGPGKPQGNPGLRSADAEEQNHRAASIPKIGWAFSRWRNPHSIALRLGTVTFEVLKMVRRVNCRLSGLRQHELLIGSGGLLVAAGHV